MSLCECGVADVRTVANRLADEHPILELKETQKAFHLTDKQLLKA